MYPENVFLVAITIDSAPDRATAERHLHQVLAPLNRTRQVESWWIAEDTRLDGSDCDSAVFVHHGHQAKAAALLHRHMLTGNHNLIHHTNPSNLQQIKRALQANADQIIDTIATDLAILGAKDEWSTDDNFDTTEEIANLAEHSNLPPVTSHPAALEIGLGPDDLGYEVPVQTCPRCGAVDDTCPDSAEHEYPDGRACCTCEHGNEDVH